jgi:hypothetical protein
MDTVTKGDIELSPGRVGYDNREEATSIAPRKCRSKPWSIKPTNATLKSLGPPDRSGRLLVKVFGGKNKILARSVKARLALPCKRMETPL